MYVSYPRVCIFFKSSSILASLVWAGLCNLFSTETFQDVFLLQGWRCNSVVVLPVIDCNWWGSISIRAQIYCCGQGWLHDKDVYFCCVVGCASALSEGYHLQCVVIYDSHLDSGRSSIIRSFKEAFAALCWKRDNEMESCFTLNMFWDLANVSCSHLLVLRVIRNVWRLQKCNMWSTGIDFEDTSNICEFVWIKNRKYIMYPAYIDKLFKCGNMLLWERW